ncbi:MAG: OmpA family protein [Bacteroidales bacterium]|jgi:peptidoglycan-associated lipoprotein|nr:OmpA family protein [Bacteroidales bacterium]
MKKFLGLFLIILTPVIMHAQKASIAKGDEYYYSYMYDLAKDYYEKALGSISNTNEKAQVGYKLGYCYKMLHDSEKSEIYFGIAVKNYSQGVTPPDVLLYYADALRMNGKYEDAIDIYKEYIRLAPSDYRGQSGLESSELAPKWLNKPTRYKVTNIAKFNSQYFDFSPTWATKDFRTIYFTSSRDGTQGDRTNRRSGQRFTDLFEITQDRKGTWSEPVPIAGAVNTPDDEGAATINMKGTEMFYTRCKGGKNTNEPCRIFYSTKKGNAWSDGIWVDLAGFSNYEVGYPALSPDDKILYFSASTPDGYGGMDLYMAKRVGTSGYKFENAVNLGPIINTAGDEVYPTVNSDGTIYFASDGHKGMGGLDIYEIKKDNNGNIISVENLKPPINSSFDDFGIIFKGKENSGYFSSNRKGGKGSDDIYGFSMPPLVITLNGVIRDTTDMTKVRMVSDAKIKITNDAGIAGELISSATGSFNFKLQENQSYKILADGGDDYFSSSISFSTHNVEYDTAINVVINLARIPRIITLPNIEYEYDKADLKPESTVALDDLVKTLNDNPRLVIELRAHTDYRGNDDYNMNLSLRRAQSCVDYLISKGIKPDRLKARGFGETDPKVIDEELAKNYPYFKVNDVLAESYILKLTPAQQEVANQLNRRTEFSVISKDYGTKSGEPIEDEKQPNTGTAIIKTNDDGDF